MQIDFDMLWPAVIAEAGHGGRSSIHGPGHWRRVERNACILASRTGAVLSIVRLFALFHDSQRRSDGEDPEHGRRGAEFAARMRDQWFNMSDTHFALLHHACVWHTVGHHHDDPTIGTCWDADRLDLGRVGLVPNPSFMSTAFGVEIATHGDIQPWLHLAHPRITFSG